VDWVRDRFDDDGGEDVAVVDVEDECCGPGDADLEFELAEEEAPPREDDIRATAMRAMDEEDRDQDRGG